MIQAPAIGCYVCSVKQTSMNHENATVHTRKLQNLNRHKEELEEQCAPKCLDYHSAPQTLLP